MLTINQLLSILKDATNRLPQLRYAYGLLGISVVAALTIRLLGPDKASIIAIASTLIGTVLVFVVAIAFGKSALAKLPAQLLVWAITLFFYCFLGFTVLAFAISWPCNWVIYLGILNKECIIPPPPKPVNANTPATTISEVQTNISPPINANIPATTIPEVPKNISPPIIDPKDNCDIVSGKITSSTGTVVNNAKITVLLPNISAYEYKSIRDNSYVLASTSSNSEGKYQVKPDFDSGYKYEMLVEAKDYIDNKAIIDQTNQCEAKNDVNVILEKHPKIGE